MQAGRQGSWQKSQCGFTSSQVLSPTWKLQALGCKPLWVVTPVGRLTLPETALLRGWEAQAPTLMPQGQYEDNQAASSPKQKLSPSQVPESLLGTLPHVDHSPARTPQGPGAYFYSRKVQPLSFFHHPGRASLHKTCS